MLNALREVSVWQYRTDFENFFKYFSWFSRKFFQNSLAQRRAKPLVPRHSGVFLRASADRPAVQTVPRRINSDTPGIFSAFTS